MRTSVDSYEELSEHEKKLVGAFADQLQSLLQVYGHWITGGESFAGKLHRKWLDVRTAFDPKNAGAMLAECERGEWTALSKYEAAIEKMRWPSGAETILIDQLAAMREARARLDQMR